MIISRYKPQKDTYVLVAKHKSSDPADTLIVTSIQKMSKIGAEEDGLNARDLEQMRGKRMVNPFANHSKVH